MIQVRSNIFETNSSSTHCLVVDNNHCSKLPEKLYFNLDQYGWEWDQVESASYFYTALYDLTCYNESLDFNQLLDKLKKILDDYNIEYEFQDPEEVTYIGIDHVNELEDFILEMLDSPDELIKFLCFGRVYTGNDNSDNSFVIDDNFIEIYYKGN